MSFRNNKLELKVSTGSLSALDEIKNAIAETASATAELGSANSGQDRATGQIRISR